MVGAGNPAPRRRDSDVSAGPPSGDGTKPDSLPLRAGLRKAAAEIVRTPPGAPEVSKDVGFAMSEDENSGCGHGYSSGAL